MEDGQIVTLFWQRDESALEQARQKYGGAVFSLALQILQNREDAGECCNDVLAAAWNAMPPHRPEKLGAFLLKLTRRTALGRLRRLTAAKRGGGAVDAALEELAECVPSGEDTGAAVEARELARAVNRFLAALPEMQRRVFLCRYWYYDSVADIARRFHWSESRVKMCCKRTREKLAAYLQKEEWL